MRILNLVTLTLVLVLTGCSDEHAANHSHEHEHSGHEDHAYPVDGSLPDLNVQLNNGHKWQLDEHTRVMFGEMTDRLESGLAAREAGQLLKADLDKLITGCTMTGDAHDQLHAYLAAYMPAVNRLAETGNPDDLDTVRDVLHQYSNYFE